MNQSKGVRKVIKLLNLEFVSNIDSMFFKIFEEVKAIVNASQKIAILELLRLLQNKIKEPLRC